MLTSCNEIGGDLMGKAKMLGQFKPCTPNARGSGKYDRRAPWQGAKKKPKQKNDNPVRFIAFDEFSPWPPQSSKEATK